MGEGRLSRRLIQLFVRLQARSSSPPWNCGDGARRSSQGRSAGPPRSGLGLDLSQPAIRLLWSGVSGPDNSLSSAIQGSSRFWQSGLRARSNSHSVVARGELHQHSACGGQAREGEAILRCGFLRPCNPSVRPPGSSGADRAPADWVWLLRGKLVLSGALHHGSLDDDASGDILPQSDEKLARQRNDRALAALLASRLEPARQLRLWLVTDPQPGELDHLGPQPWIAG